MSDQSSPPKPKPGSLRDRIAAFENKGASNTPAGPPPPRPKPGGLQWKPRPPSPPTAAPDVVPVADRKAPSTGGMSASDAMESIGRGGSLKERMAALQGKGAFGGPPPPIAPKPNVDKPKWKPPPIVPAPASPETDHKEGIDVGAREASRSPPPRAVGSPTPENQETHRECETEGDGADPDPEEEERQRRAAIAARMARLGGAKFGMVPPILAPKPVVRKSEPAPEVREERGDESNEAVAPPRAASSVPEAVAKTEHKDEPEPSSVAPRAPSSMPMPVGPRRAAPPRKKSSKNAPTTALPEPPAEDAAVQPPPIAVVEGASLGDSQEIAGAAEATHDAQSQPAEEPQKQEAEEDLVEDAPSHVEADDSQEAPSELPAEAVEADEEEEAQRQRVAAKLAQMGAFNPLAGPPAPRQPSLDEPAPESSKVPLNVEDEVNVDTEEYGEIIPPPPAIPPRRDTIQSITADQDDSKVDAGDRVTAQRDGERAVASYAEEQTGGQSSEDPLNAHIAPMEADDKSGTPRLNADVQDKSHGDTVTNPHDGSRIEAEPEVPSPRLIRPIPPPPVNLRSKPTPPSSPPLSPPAKTPLQALRVDEEECPPSPDIPPRPIPPPGRSGSMMEDTPSPPPRRSMPPPPRRVSIRTDRVTSPPSSPPPGPTSPRPVSQRPDTPPIITTLDDKDHAAEEDTAEIVTPRPDSPEDEESARRRAIAERMARLGGIRFGGPPPMNPLSRPPLPAAPPPTSIPPDDDEDEPQERKEAEDEGTRKQRIASKLAGMGGMHLGMFPPTAVPRRLTDSENEDVVPVPVPAPQRAPPTRKPPPPFEAPELDASAQGRRSNDSAQVSEGSEVEVRSSDAEDEGRREALPTPPPYTLSRSPPPIRPMIPTLPSLFRRASSTTGSAASSRQPSLDESGTPTGGNVLRPSSEYVMVEAESDEQADEDAAPTPRRKPTRAGRTIPAPPPVPPPSAIDPPERSVPQWELPTIPQGSEAVEGEEAEEGGSEDSTAVVSDGLSSSVVGSRSVTSSGTGSVTAGSSGRRSLDQPQLSTDALLAIWGKTGVRVVEAATALHEKSKRSLVGDGSHAGFVRAVLAQVPGVAYPVGTGTGAEDDWGYVVYAQTGTAVQRRVSDIMPGDVIAFRDAKLKGHKGLAAYTQTAGADEPLVGVVSALDARKSKVRVWQANQHVGQQNGVLTPRAAQTVENVSYRLEDLKSGQVTVYRVLEA